MAKLPFALQLFSVRDALNQDLAATLARVKAIGYDYVETAGAAGKTPEEFRAALDGASLTAISAHVDYETCRDDLGAAIAACQSLGVSWAVIPWLNPGENPGAADWGARAREMESFGEAFQEAGIQLCYHNHVGEFVEENGKTFFDLIFETASPQFLAVELDVGWAHYAGADPVALLRQYAGRTPLVQIKDIKARVEGEAPITTELGNGATRLEPILATAGETGVAWLIVEQDDAARDPLESARMNAAYMRVHVF